MSLSHETMLELMSLADGELEGEAKIRAERLVATSDEARRVVEAMRGAHLGEWLGDVVAQRAEAAGADRIADAVILKVSAQRKASRLRVVVGGGCAVLALAAGILLYARGDAARSEGQAPVASIGAANPEIADQTPPLHGVEVDEIDSPSHGVSVFEIPMGAAAVAAGPGRAASVVIWIDDESGSK